MSDVGRQLVQDQNEKQKDLLKLNQVPFYIHYNHHKKCVFETFTVFVMLEPSMRLVSRTHVVL